MFIVEQLIVIYPMRTLVYCAFIFGSPHNPMYFFVFFWCCFAHIFAGGFYIDPDTSRFPWWPINPEVFHDECIRAYIADAPTLKSGGAARLQHECAIWINLPLRRHEQTCHIMEEQVVFFHRKSKCCDRELRWHFDFHGIWDQRYQGWLSSLLHQTAHWLGGATAVKLPNSLRHSKTR